MKRTGGGRFNPFEPPIYFTAGNFLVGKQHARSGHTLIALNDLEAQGWKDEMTNRLENGGKVLLDSGIFWLTNRHKREHNISMDEALRLHPEQIDGFDKLWAAYLTMVKQHESDLWGFIELDQGGADRKRETRKLIEAEGVVPIPVYHPIVDGWDYFDELAENYDRICVGNVVQASPPDRRRILASVWERHRRYPDLWIHVLGLTPNTMIATNYFNSCDSSSMVSILRWRPQTSPMALSALRKLANPENEYSYEKGSTDSYDLATDLVYSSGHFITQAWRGQWEADKRMSEPLPAIEPWEPALRK